jgi:hypothetical protein
MSMIATLNDGDAYDLWEQLWERQENPFTTKTIPTMPSFHDVEDVPLTFRVLAPHPFFPRSVNEIVIKSSYEQMYTHCESRFTRTPHSTVVASGHPGIGACRSPFANS